MGGATASNSPKPSSSAVLDLWTLVITMIEAVDLEAAGVYLQVSLCGDKRKQKQCISVHKDGSTNPWLGRTFNFTVDKAVAPSCCLKFKIKIKKAKFIRKDVGEVDVQVTDLLEKGANGDVKPEVLSYEVRSSSGETKGVLRFYCQLLPPPVKKVDEPVTSHPAAEAPPASNSAAAYPPPTHGEAPPPSGYPPAGHPPQASHQPAANPTPAANLPVSIPPAEAPPPSGHLPAGHPPQASYPPAANPPPAANLLGAVPPAEVPPPSGYLPAGHPPQAANPPGAIWPAANLPGAIWPAGYPPQGYGHKAPQLAYQRPSGRGDFVLGFASRLIGEAISGMVGDAISGMLDSVNDA